MNALRKATERASDKELSLVSKLSRLERSWPMSAEEKLVNPGLFMRRQELSYLIANYEVFKLIQNVKGSVFYFGVYHGAGFMNFANLSAALEPFNHTREIIGFDTFDGYPEIGEQDKTHGKKFHTLTKGGFKSSSKEYLERLFDIYDQNRPVGHVRKCKLVKGDICKTLPEYMEKNQHTVIALAVITVNLYEPTKTIIHEVWPFMPKGAVLIVHSLNEDYYPGVTAATMRILQGEVMMTFPYAPNMAYIVKGA